MSVIRVVIIAGLFLKSVLGAGICATVLDTAEGPLPGASVSIVSLLTDQRYSTTTDSKGHACVKKMPEGIYSVEAGLARFLYACYYPVRLKPSYAAKFTFRLPLGEITMEGQSFTSRGPGSGHGDWRGAIEGLCGLRGALTKCKYGGFQR